jgi:hypothetical protein
MPQLQCRCSAGCASGEFAIVFALQARNEYLKRFLPNGYLAGGEVLEVAQKSGRG